MAFHLIYHIVTPDKRVVLHLYFFIAPIFCRKSGTASWRSLQDDFSFPFEEFQRCFPSNRKFQYFCDTFTMRAMCHSHT